MPNLLDDPIIQNLIAKQEGGKFDNQSLDSIKQPTGREVTKNVTQIPTMESAPGLTPEDQGVYGVIKSPMDAYVFEKSYNKVRETNSTASKDSIQLRDRRTTDAATGKAVTDQNRFGYQIDRQTARDLIQSAKERGLDPYTVLSMSLQETGVARLNPLHDNAQSLDNFETMKGYAEKFPKGITAKNVNDSSIDNLAEKVKYAQSLGKTSEADKIQAWNGYGSVENMYGIPGKTNMSKNPVYGKRVIDLKNNVIKTNPEIAKLMAELNAGMAEGGLVKGSGTGKSDSIPAELEQGDFIVPVENAEMAMQLGQKYLGWEDDQEAETEGGDVEKHLSNGEVHFTADEVEILKAQGIDMNTLAPNAQQSEGMKSGGLVYNPETGQFEMVDKEQPVNPEDMPADFVGEPTIAIPQAPVVPGAIPGAQPRRMTIADLIRTQQPIDDSAETQARAKKAALMSGIGQVFGNLASAVGGRDSRTPRLQQDQNIQKLYAIAENDKQKHEMLTRDWNARLGAATMQDQQIEMGNKRLEAQTKLAAERQRFQDAKDERDFGFKVNSEAYDRMNDAEKLKYDIGRDKINDDFKRRGLEIQAARANKETATEAKINDAMRWMNPVTGKEENPYDKNTPAISKAQRDALFDEAIKNAKPDEVNAVMQQYQLAPESGKNQVIVTYLNNRARDKKLTDDRIKSANLDRKRTQVDTSKLDITGQLRDPNSAPPGMDQPVTAKPTVTESKKKMPDGRIAVFDSNTKKFIRYE